MSKLNAKSLAEAIAAALAPVLVAAFGGTTAASNDADDDGEEEAPKKGRGRPVGSTKTNKVETKPAVTKKSSKPADEEEEEEEEEQDDGLDGLGDEEEEATQEDVVNAFKALKASKGIDKCREVLAKLDESNVLNIPPKKYADALKEINRAGSKK